MLLVWSAVWFAVVSAVSVIVASTFLLAVESAVKLPACTLPAATPFAGVVLGVAAGVIGVVGGTAVAATLAGLAAGVGTFGLTGVAVNGLAGVEGLIAVGGATGEGAALG